MQLTCVPFHIVRQIEMSVPSSWNLLIDCITTIIHLFQMLIRQNARSLSTFNTNNRMLSWVHRQELPLRAFFCLYDTFCNAAFHGLPHNVLCRFLPVYCWENLVTCSERVNYKAAAWPIDKRRGISLLWPLAGPYRRIGNVKGWGFESQVSLNGSVGGLGAAASRTSGRNAETARVARPMEADLSLLLSFIVRAGRWKAWQRLWLQAAKLAAPSTQYAAKVLEWQRLHSLWR